MIATTVLSTLGASGAGSLGAVSKIFVLVASVALNVSVFVFAFRIATARELTVAQIAPGAIAAAVAWKLLQSFGVLYVGHVVKNASATSSTRRRPAGLAEFAPGSSTSVRVYDVGRGAGFVPATRLPETLLGVWRGGATSSRFPGRLPTPASC